MSRRSRAREVVMQLLYRDDLNGRGDQSSDNHFLATRLNGNRKLVEFADTILQGVRQHRDAIDERLAATADNWRLERMAATDRNVLRIAAWELLYGDTPDRVAINEAIEMSRRYGDMQSSRFVNGILDRLLKNRLAESAATASDSSGNQPPHDTSPDVG